MPLPLITPQQATALIAEGAKLIDIRDTDEYAREHIALARSVPLDSLPGALQAQAGETVICQCTGGLSSACDRLPRAPGAGGLSRAGIRH